MIRPVPLRPRRPVAYERLSAQDRWLLVIDQPDLPMHVAALAIFETASCRLPGGEFDLERLHRLVAARPGAGPAVHRVLGA